MSKSKRIDGNKKTKENIIPEPSLRRLPWYLSYAKVMYEQGKDQISSTQIAKGVDIDSALVAKDLSHIDLQGRTRVGYKTKQFIDVLERFLGFTNSHKSFVVGVGNLGSALMNDKGLKQFGLEVEAGFDVSETLIGTEVAGLMVYNIDTLKSFVKKHNITIAILTVPAKYAQSTSDFLVECGVKTIWNFTTVRIRVPNNIVVQNTCLYAHLAVMFTRIKEINGDV